MSIDFVNDWFIFDDVIDKKTCDKIKKAANGNWNQGAVNKYSENEEITKEEFSKIKKVSKIDWDSIIEHEDNTTSSQELACSGDKCDIL